METPLPLRYDGIDAVEGQLALFADTIPPVATVHAASSPDWICPPVALTGEVSALLGQGVPVAIGISGGKDGSSAALATLNYLQQIGHQGPRILIHSDLGRIEWNDSARVCHQLSTQLGLELVTLQRQAGDMVDRWLTRWHRNVERYTQLQCVKLILPWSTASMRFCTSELKTALIARYLTNRFQNTPIVSVTGIRRQESSNRAKKPIAKENTALVNRGRGTSGIDWHPIIEWSESDVWSLHHRESLPIHEAYSTYGANRVSCCNCILSSEADLLASASCETNHAVRSELVDLELTSTFSFQSDRWLADVRPDLLSEPQRIGLAEAKRIAGERTRLEAQIPAHLLFNEGWPEHMPTRAEARLLARIRSQVGALLGFRMEFIDEDSILDRYSHLLLLADAARARKAVREEKAALKTQTPGLDKARLQKSVQGCLSFA